ncbi:MAG TPA: bifunctional helix-turn-helix domain-containing protein/methylated-DNA--[protein]-cysteine S-methyltransferase [Azospira sp.]|nr:bifunctional helix-turn-helix domain-containing protein/methylated-DNA--[protein]-cysteine S-methyltransferase [Azospira sp.]
MTQAERNPYATVAEAIRFVRSQAREQPSLARIAEHVGLSPTHLQRTFSAWAGISPKRFLQFLTKEHARGLLRESRDVLATSLETGLSGPGRLHDLMVSCEALTPGEIGALGDGLTLRFGFAQTPLGQIVAAISARGVCHLHFVEAGDEEPAEALLRAEWPRARWVRDDGAVGELAQRMFSGNAGDRPLSLLLRGTNFQIKVWEALIRIPAGRVLAYGDLAGWLGTPRAQRAVGSALAKNRIAVLVPCHRVIREGGEIGEYRWGSERKCALLAYEGIVGSARD